MPRTYATLKGRRGVGGGEGAVCTPAWMTAIVKNFMFIVKIRRPLILTGTLPHPLPLALTITINRGKILSPWLWDIVDSGCRTGPLAYVTWRAGTTNLCQAAISPQSGTKIWLYSYTEGESWLRIYSKVNPMPKSTISPSQGLWIWL